MHPGAHVWELARDLDLTKDPAERARILQAIDFVQKACTHISNPEHPERCYKCGVSPLPHAEARPGIVKARRKPLEVKIRYG